MDTTPAPLRAPLTLRPPEIALLPVMAAPPLVTVKPPAPLREPLTLSAPVIVLLPVMVAPPPVTVKPLGKDSDDDSEGAVT